MKQLGFFTLDFTHELIVMDVKSLLEALPWIRKFHGKIFVIKIGGKEVENDEILRGIIQDIILLQYIGVKTIIVHGGGKEASEISKKLGITPNIVEGRRVTDDKALDVVSMVYRGRINLRLISMINKFGGKAIGLSGADGKLIIGEKRKPMNLRVNGIEKLVDLGYVADIKAIQVDPLLSLINLGYILVICPLVGGEDGHIFNMNADYLAAALAPALKATKLIVVSDVPGVLENENDETSLIPTLGIKEAEELLASSKIRKGMKIKLEACLTAVKNGTPKVHIINGNIPNAILLEILSDKGIGTMLEFKENAPKK